MSGSPSDSAQHPNDIPTSPADVAILDELRSVLSPPAPPPSLRAACLDLLTWRTIDHELAELLSSSELTDVRSTVSNVLAFAVDGLTIEVSLGDRHGMMVGEVRPAASGFVTLQTLSDAKQTALDPFGRFTFAVAVHGLFRLRLQLEGRRPVVTSWAVA